MGRKPTGRPRGRPRKLPEDIAAKLAAGEMAPEDAAAQTGVGRSTAYRAAKAPPARPKPAAHPPGRPTPADASTGQPAASKRGALLAALGAALDADPTLLEALPVDAEELGRRLAAPALPPMPDDGDPLSMVQWVETVMAREATKLTGAQAAARRQALALVVQAAKGRAQILRDMKAQDEETPEVLAGRQIEAIRDAAIAKVLEHLEAEEARAA